MKKIIASLAFVTLAACGSDQPAPEQAAASPTPSASPSMPTPDQALFASVFADACPKAEKVAASLCRSEGMGKDGFVCEFHLGKEDAPRRTTRLVANDGQWTLAEPEKACAADPAA